MGQLASAMGVERRYHPDSNINYHHLDQGSQNLRRISAVAAPSGARTNAQVQGLSSRSKATPNIRARLGAAYTLRSMKLGDVGRAMKIAADNFRGEVGLVARSYLWHFSRRAGLGNLGTMWTKRVVKVSAPGERTFSFDLLSSFVHDRDVAWVDLADRPSPDIEVAIEAFRQWPCRHRLLVVRVSRPRAVQLLEAGFWHAGRIPGADGEHVYLYAQRDRLEGGSAPKLKIRFGRRRRIASECDFSVVEREGSVLGLTGVYETDIWQRVTWGAWGAVDRASARRDAVFEILRLTEERACAAGAQWFCLETSDAEKYRHARRLYELHGLELLMKVPGFYQSDAGSEALMIYGKRLPTSFAEPARVDEVPLAA